MLNMSYILVLSNICITSKFITVSSKKHTHFISSVQVCPWSMSLTTSALLATLFYYFGPQNRRLKKFSHNRRVACVPRHKIRITKNLINFIKKPIAQTSLVQNPHVSGSKVASNWRCLRFSLVWQCVITRVGVGVTSYIIIRIPSSVQVRAGERAPIHAHHTYKRKSDFPKPRFSL